MSETLRGEGGRYLPGTKGGPGNPHPKKVARLRTKLFEWVTDDDLKEVIDELVAMAKGGDIQAIKELLDRMLGKANQPIEVEGEESSDEKMIRVLRQIGVYRDEPSAN